MDADLFLDDAPAASRWRSRLAAAHPRHWLGTLKVRLAAGVLLALLGGIIGVTWRMGVVAEQHLLEQALRREQHEADRAAAALARRVAELQRALALAAGQLARQSLDDAAQLEDFARAQPWLLQLFDYVNVAARDGRVVLSFDAAGARRPLVSIADREHFRLSVEQRRPQVSPPLQGRLAGEPIVVFTHPLVADGDVVAVLIGVHRLARRGLVADLADTGDDGALVVVADADGQILAHRQSDMLLRTLVDEPRLGAVGDGVAPAVVAAAAVAATGWQVWRAAPTRQLLAPLERARAEAVVQACVVAALLAAALAAFLAWQLQPLRRLEARAVALLHGKDDGDWPDAGGEIGQLARTLRHVWAERAQVESFNAEVLRKLGSVMAAAPVGLAFARHQRFDLVSAEFAALLGRRDDEIVGQPTALIFASADDHRQLGVHVLEAFRRGEPYVGEWQLARADGHRFWARLRARPVDAGDASAGTIWSVNDISDQVHARAQLEHDALHDALTGVVNRKGFERALARVFGAPASARPAAIVMLDLDHFKPINDSAGHAAGDRMLVAVAQAMTAAVRASDTVARLGGDEFALLLPHCDQAQALVVAEKVREAICDIELPWQGRVLRVGVSLGVCELVAAHADVAQWLADADDACYAAKRGGRGAVRARAPLRLVGADG